jgi:TonB-linked SusC/RagA family outer membrane protein
MVSLALVLIVTPAVLSAQAITGKVTDVTGAPLVAVTVTVEGAAVGAQTRDDGTYRITGAPAGARILLARRVGYAASRQAVTVGSADVTVNFQLTAAPASLEAVVATATGAQRKIELGNTVESINAAQRAETVPVRTMGEMLTAQATGVQVIPATVTGTASRIRIRGQASRARSNDPIYFVDGVRINTSTGGIDGAGTPSRLNDINPEEIESIEIVKGPSASTLYGTDAANGVIVITTKRGRAGATRWDFHGERSEIRDENDYYPNYQLVGRSVAPGSPLRKCRSYEIAAGTCIYDSAYELNILKTPDVTFIGPGNRHVAGGSLSGGNNSVRFFLSGDRNVEYGPWKLPDFDRQRFEANGQEIRDYMDRPSQYKQSSARGNVSVVANPKIDIAVNTGFTFSELRLPRSELGGNSINGMWQAAVHGNAYRTGPGVDNPFHPADFDLGGYLWETPGMINLKDAKQTTNRFIGGATANWRPISWLTLTGSTGVDLIARRDKVLDRFGEIAYAPTFVPQSTDSRNQSRGVTADARGTANWQARPWAQVRSTLGLQFVGTSSGSAAAANIGLGPGAENPTQGTAGTATISASNTENRTIGAYIEEHIALRDRLYLTLAARSDQNSAFGSDIKNVIYPKASLSWIATDEPFFPSVPFLNQLRVRAALGSSGVQPGLNDAIRTYSSSGGFYRDTLVNGITPSNPGNPDLKPERSTEFETGFESRWWNERLNAEFTYYRKQTKDALVSQPVAPSAGVSSFTANLGGMQNAGIEYRVTAQMVDTRNYGLDMMFSGSKNNNKITSLGGVLATPTAANQEGRPVNSVFVRPVTLNSTAGQGVMGLLRTTDITIASPDSAIYLGPQLSPVEMTFTAGVEFLQRRLRISTLFDRKAGGYQQLEFQITCSQSIATCPWTNRLTNTLQEQAWGIAQRVNGVSTGFWQKMDFIRWRELSASYDLGEPIAHRFLGARGARINLSMRNIMFWSDWAGVDPEGVQGTNGNTTSGQTTPGLPTFYTVRLNLSF